MQDDQRGLCSPRHTIVMSTHLVDEIEPMIDGAIFVRDGQDRGAGQCRGAAAEVWAFDRADRIQELTAEH